MTRLRCVGRYTNDARGLAFAVGDEFDADPALLTYLTADAPGCFAPVMVKQVATPPQDKAMKAPDKAK